MRILLVISEVPPVRSGVARVAKRLSEGLSDLGYHVDLLSRRDLPHWELGEIRLSAMPLRLRSLRECFQGYDLIHLHGPVPTFSDVFLLRGLHGLGPRRPKLVYTHHAPVDLQGFPIRYLARVYNALQERLAALADHVAVMTPAYGQRMSRYIPQERLSVIPWGVDHERFYAPVEKPGPFTALYLGQVRPYKGLPVLLRAAAGLSGVRVWVIGTGHYEATCRRLAKRLDLSQVTFWGSLPDDEMIALVKQAHAIVLPSVTRSEAFGIALLEGMAAGNVPVASHLPGVADLVGSEGFTFPPGDEQALRAVLQRLQDDPLLRAHTASLAQAKAALYPWERTVFEYDRIFRRLVAQPQAVPVSPACETKMDATTQPAP
ncbi:MAG: glycosyltransferase family 4 protein [Anaerolineae bacterium]|nr:glycosyltransferase family 4 protein [Anaerolineae bacterium]